MRLLHLHAVHFRNLKELDLELGPGLHLFLGKNGQGKTNLLEAVQILSSLRSFRPALMGEVLAHGQQEALLEARVDSGGVPVRLRMRIRKDGKRLWMGEKAVHSVRDYLGNLQVAAFTPDDLNMIKGGPLLRRRFLDRAVFLFQPEHLLRLRDFNQALRSRNGLLRNDTKADAAQLEAWTQSLAQLGAPISLARLEVLSRLEDKASLILSRIEDASRRLQLSFRPGWPMAGTDAIQQAQHDLLEALRRRMVLDRRRQKTTLGPQLDDYDIQLDGLLARKYASQGQQRSVAVSLILSVVEELHSIQGERPLILLDDVSSELDQSRRRAVFEHLASHHGQVLMTTTDKALVEDLGSLNPVVYEVENGEIHRLDGSDFLYTGMPPC